MEKFFTKHPRIQKTLAFLLIVFIFIPTIFVYTPPKETKAQWVVTDPPQTAIGIKDLAGQLFKQVAMGIARKMLNAMTTRAVNWINSGFHGNPFYLSNEDAFFKDIVKYEVKNLVDVFAYNKTKFPFGKQFALNTINSYQRQLEDNTAYSLSKVIQDPVYLESYRNDFNVGGWNGFFINTQYPQNNYIGFTMMANEDLARKLDGTTTTAAGKVQDTLDKSQGFLAPKICTTNKLYNNGKNEFLQPKWSQSDYDKKYPYKLPYEARFNQQLTPEESEANRQYDQDYSLNLEEDKAAWETKNACPGGLTTTTPGGVVANQIMTATSSKFRQSELGQAVGNSLSAVFDALVSKLVDKGVGLLGLGSKNVAEDSKATEFDYKSGIKGASGGGTAQICTDIQIAGGGRDTDGNPIDIDGGGQSCTTIPQGTIPAGVDPLSFFNIPGSGGTTGGGTGGTGGDNPPTGGSCVGGNTQCTCAEGVATYDVYASAVATAEAKAFPDGLPPSAPPDQVRTRICAEYAGPGTCRAGKQEDELIIEGLPGKYVTLSIDFLIGGSPFTGFSSRAVAACEAGQQ